MGDDWMGDDWIGDGWIGDDWRYFDLVVCGLLISMTVTCLSLAIMLLSRVPSGKSLDLIEGLSSSLTEWIEFSGILPCDLLGDLMESNILTFEFNGFVMRGLLMFTKLAVPGFIT